MMRLRDAAKFFDRTEILNPANGQVLFRGQLEPYDDSKRDGVGSERRILAYTLEGAAPIPVNRIIKFSGQLWVAGKAQPDEFDNAIIREKMVVQRADSAFTPFTSAQLLRGDVSESEPCGSVWTRDMSQENVTSDVFAAYTLWVGANRPTLDDYFVVYLGKLHKVINCYIASSGLQGIEVSELPRGSVQEVAFVSGSTFDRVLGKNTVKYGKPRMAIVLPFYEKFRLVSQAAAKPSKGDLSMIVLKADGVVAAGDQVQLHGGFEYTVRTVLEETADTYQLHIAR